ncbi:MAG TPA: transcription termination factor NusA [Candidatus Dormibacteraeota bacterium]|nr:transcription termination factor NusA [Candidatus Dormibacteraeota bacterium]
MSRAGSRSQSEPSTESLGEALTALCAEVGIPFEEMLHTVEGALAGAYVRAFNPAGFVTVKLDITTGALDVRSRLVRPDGTEVIESLPAENFKRMAAQTAKHAVLRHIHDLERDKVMRDVAEHRGELASGIVDRVEAGTVFVDLGRIEGVMPPEEQIPGEQLHPGRPVLVVILEPQHNPRQAQVRVSRGARAFVHRLLEAEVPEIKAGTVQIRSIAREPGLRTKIAVSATEPGIDPVGACVGPKGVRHRAILSELSNEHVDIVPWSDDAEVFVAASLGPAKPEAVSIDRNTRTATVLVPRGQLSLAIGRDGQNARLAAKLTGFRIDIKPSDSDVEAGGEAAP